MSASPPSTGGRRGTLVAGSVVAVLVLAAAFATARPQTGEPFDPDSTDPDGLRGVVELLGALDVDVSVSLDPPQGTGSTVFVPVDLLNSERRERLLDWVEDGGTLVVAGADARTHGLAATGGSFADVFGSSRREPDCAVPALAEVGEVVHAGWTAMSVPEQDAVPCFPLDDSQAWLVIVPRGDGSIVALGSAAPFTNDALDRADNAVLAAALLGPVPGGSLVIVPRPPVGDGDVPVLDLVPAGFWRGLVLASLALVLLVLWRARRLGRPVAERLPPVLPSAELVRSVANLLERAGDRTAAASQLRDDARAGAVRALGCPATLPPQTLAELIGRRAGVPLDTAQRAVLDTPVRDDAELTGVATAVREVRDALHHPRPATAGGTGTTERSRT